MQAIHQTLEQFRSLEISLLSERQRAASQAEEKSLYMAELTAVLAIVCAILGTFLTLRDQNQERINRIRSQLEHVSRLNTIGEYAAMLSHEIAQPLSATGNYLDAAKRFLCQGDDASAREAIGALGLASKQVHSAGEVLRHLRTFIAKKDSEITVETAGGLIEEAIELLALSRQDVLIERLFDEPAAPAVRVDRVQIIQVLINLMRNAMQAMDARERRELRCAAAAEGEAAVRFTIGDNGPGLSPEEAARLFEPFASSKKGGMGVGLSICHTIVSAHGGRIWAEVNASGGATFHFTLPQAR